MRARIWSAVSPASTANGSIGVCRKRDFFFMSRLIIIVKVQNARPTHECSSMKKKSRFLQMPVEPFKVAPYTEDEILWRMERVSFQGRNLATARRIWERMLGSD